MWIEIVVDGLLGGVAGVFAWFVTRKLGDEHRKKSVIPAVCVALAVVVGHQVVVPVVRAHRERRELYDAGLAIYGNPGATAAFVEAMAPIVRHPGLRASLNQQPSASGGLAAVPVDGMQEAFAALTAKGMARVSPPELEALFDAKRKLAELSPELCAGFWNGGVSAAQLMGGIRRLPESDQIVWIRTTAAAMMLELEGRTPPRPPAGDALPKAMEKLIDALPDDEKAALVKASAGGTITPEEACAAFRALAAGVKKLLPPEGRDAMIWGVSNPNG